MIVEHRAEPGEPSGARFSPPEGIELGDALLPGDPIRIGNVVLTFRSDRFHQAGPNAEVDVGLTTTKITEQALAMVVGDVTNYSTISQSTDHLAIIGDSTNVAFRLSGLAGRAGRPAVLVTSAVHEATAARYVWGDAEQLVIKGRSGLEYVFPVLGRAE